MQINENVVQGLACNKHSVNETLVALCTGENRIVK